MVESNPSQRSIPEPEEVEDLLLSCRYGELEEVKEYVEKFGNESIGTARDERGNTVLHMCCGNGHVDILNYLLPLIPSSLLSQTNDAGSPPLHWAILNNHVNCVKVLAEWPEEKGGGLPLLKQTNGSGRPAFSEAVWAGEGKEEVAGWIEGFLWRAEGEAEGEDEEGDETGAGGESLETADEVKVSAGDEVAKDESATVDEIVGKTDELEVGDRP